MILRRHWAAASTLCGPSQRRHQVCRGENARQHEQGSGTVWAIGIIIVLVLCLAGVAALMRVQQTVAVTHTAADLAALAAAQKWAAGEGDPCGLAAEVVAAHGVRLESCRYEGEDVLVEVSRTVTLLGVFGGRYTAHAAARAGPEET